jgi:Ca2+-binding EF-hand superfamily protein
MNISSISSQITNNIFSKIDTNNQGYIDKSGLSSALSNINGSSNETDTEDVFNNMDVDGDGKLTKSELTKGIENLLSQLQSSAMRPQSKEHMPPPPEGMEGMPPPPPIDENNGVTQEQASEIASNSDDTNLASLMSTISENFEAADTNQDGKVSAQEAMAFQKSADKSEQQSTPSNANYSAQNIIQQLIKAYGFDNEPNSSLLESVIA